MDRQTRLEAVGPARQPVLARLWQMYRHDLGEFRDSPPDEDGAYREHELPAFFTGDADRQPYLIRHGDALGGFALVLGATTEPRKVYAFFVVRALRRKKVGYCAAREMLHRHPGAWEIAFQEENPGAARFWRQVAVEAADARSREERRPVPGKPWLPPDTFIVFQAGGDRPAPCDLPRCSERGG